MKESECPCVDCITLPICKSEVLKRERNQYVFIFITLEIKCYMFQCYLRSLEYIKEPKGKGSYRILKDTDETSNLLKFFGLHKKVVELC